MTKQTATFYLKLRRNIALEGDLALAERELAAFFERVPGSGSFRARGHERAGLDGARPGSGGGRDDGSADSTLRDRVYEAEGRSAGIRGYSATGPLALLGDLVRASTFYTRILASTADTPAARDWLAAAESACGPVFAWWDAGDAPESLVIEAIPHNLLFELSDVVVRRASSAGEVRALLDGLLATLLGKPAGRRAREIALEALSARQTTSHLFHDLHYYKAKFFPRMVRAVLNTGSRRLGPGTHRVLDPFAGSGTTLLEASLLSLPSTGLDLDPLSVRIARAKLRGLEASGREMEETLGRVLEALGAGSGVPTVDSVRAVALGQETPGPSAPIPFPAWLTRNRRFTSEIAAQLSAEIREVQRALAACSPDGLPFVQVLVSDAISRRIRMRLLGTGVGRFSLSYSSATLPQMLAKALIRAPRIAAAAEWMRDRLNLRPARAEALVGDARRMPLSPREFDLLVTSPPYLPASSGRETYSKARALSFLALGLLERDDVDALAGEAIGSMDGSAPDLAALDLESLSEAERDLVAWLQSDDLRAIKAVPTARYFQDMRETFAQMRRILAPGGLAVVVSGRQSTFYQFATRQPLYVVESARLLAESARAAGFEIEELLDIQLAKSNMNARPRSLDDYYETLIVLRQPDLPRDSSGGQPFTSARRTGPPRPDVRSPRISRRQSDAGRPGARKA